MSTRKLLKLKYELDSLDLETKRMGVKIQQFRVGLLAFGLELKRKKKVEEPIASTEEIHTQEHNEVNFDLPPKFDEYEDQEEEMEESMVEEQQEKEVVYAKEDDMLELKPLLSTQKCTFSPYCETPTTFVPLPPHQIAKFHSFEPIKEGGFFLSLNEPTPKPYVENDKLENLRANSFLEGENDVYLLGVHCHSFNPTPWEFSSTRVQAYQGSFWTLLFEFHDKRHVIEFYWARKELRQSNGTIGTSLRNKPMFVCHLDQVP